MIRSLIRDSAVYAVGAVAGRMVGFIMIPIYTRVLTPADYGVLEVVNRLTDVIGIILALGVAHATLRYYNEPPNEERRKALVATAVLIGLTVTGVGLAVLLPTAPALTQLAYGVSDHVVIVRIAIGGILVETLITLPLTIMRARSEAWRFTMYSMLQLSTTLSLNILLVVVLRYGVLGVVLSGLLSSSIWGFVLTGSLVGRVGLSFDRGFARQLLIYGLPLVPASLATFVLNFSDRFFLVRWATAEELGLYSLAYRFALLVSVFLGLLGNAYWPWIFRVHKLPERVRLMREGGAFLIVASAAFSAGIILLSKPVILFVAAPEFAGGADYVPLLAMAYWLFATASVFSLGARLADRTDLLAWANGFAAVVCILLSLWLIPQYGVWGAVWVTVVSFAVRSFAIHRGSHSVMVLDHQWGAIWVSLVVVVAAVCYSMWSVHVGTADVTLRLAMTIALTVGLALYYLWSTDRLGTVFGYLHPFGRADEVSDE